MKIKLTITAILLFILVWGCKHDPLVPPADPTPIVPPPGSNLVCFESDVLPLFQSYCAKSGCHDPASHEEGYILNSYVNIMRKGIVAGSPNTSTIYRVLYATGESKMPPNGQAQLSESQKNLIGQWISEGAKNTTGCGVACDANAFAYNANIKPIMNTYCVGCHSSSNASGGIDVSTYNGTKAAATSGKLYGSVAHLSGYSPMPQGASQLSDCQITVIKKWIDAGSPNN